MVTVALVIIAIALLPAAYAVITSEEGKIVLLGSAFVAGAIAFVLFALAALGLALLAILSYSSAA